MDFLLTIYICSAIAKECIQPKLEDFGFKQFYGTHYGCVRAGLSNSFEIMYDGKTLSANIIETSKIYPKFSCVPVSVEESPEVPGIGTPS